MLNVKAKLLDLIQPAREKSVDVAFGAQPRDRLVVRPEREIGQDPRRPGGAAAEQVVTQGVDHGEQLEDVLRVCLLGRRELATHVGHRRPTGW